MPKKTASPATTAKTAIAIHVSAFHASVNAQRGQEITILRKNIFK
jgi:hypothetical protein